MSIPLNTFTATPQVAGFLPPLDDGYNPLSMRISGGVAINDGSQGRQTQNWTLTYNASTITLTPASTGSPFNLVVPLVLSASAAFDANMQPVICYTLADGAYLYYFDTPSSSFVTLHVVGASSARCCVDKLDAFFSAQSDVLFAYVRGASLYYRQQRDRYATEYLIGPATGAILRFGPSVVNRLQIEMLAGTA